MASQPVSRNIIDGNDAAALECTFCKERFTNPKLLPCIHSFCLGCLEKWVEEKKKLICPMCREVFQIPTGGLNKLKNNIYINDFLDYVTNLEEKLGHKLAPACACKKKASFFCRDCDELYCSECIDAHNRRMDNHIITQEEEASTSLNCSEHNKPLQFFCDTCKRPVCVRCTLVQHPQGDAHKIVDIKNAFEAFSTQASQLIETSDTKLIGFRQMVKELEKKKLVVTSNYSKCKTDITRQADELHRLIDDHKEQQLQDLESSHKQKLKLLRTQVSDVELTIATLSSMRGITHNLASCPNQVMALKSSSDATGRLDKLLNDEGCTEPEELAVLEYNQNSRLSQLLVKEVVKRLPGQGNHISPNKSTIQLPVSLPSSVFYVNPNIASLTTQNALGETVYIMDARIKCLGIDRANRGRIIMEEISVTDQHNGCYDISCNIPFSNCTLICMIIDRSDAYVNIIGFDKHGNCSGLKRNFKPVLNS